MQEDTISTKRDAVIGEELECQHKHGNAAMLKMFHFHRSRVLMKNFNTHMFLIYVAPLDK